MKTLTKTPTHTPTPLTQQRSGYQAHYSEHARVIKSNGIPIGHIYGSDVAERFVRAVNSHQELVQVAKDLLTMIEHEGNVSSSPYRYIAMRAEEALARAEATE